MTQHAHAAAEPTSSARRRIVCGWCNRLVSLDDTPGAPRHVTCDDCRGVAVDLAGIPAVVAAVPRSERRLRP